MKFFSKLVKTIAIVCNQWGDTGKGKWVDILAQEADIIARGTGGANAGHTIVHNGRELITHLIPAGILRDKDDKINALCSGMAFDPYIFCGELGMINAEGLSHERLYVSHNAKLVLPQHKLLDRIKEAANGNEIGTTGKGIGPCYTDHTARVGLRVGDLQNVDRFVGKFKKNFEDKQVLLMTKYGLDAIEQVLNQEDMGGGDFFSPSTGLDVDAAIGACLKYYRDFEDMVRNTESMIREAHGKKNILLEGAQGFLLDVDHGTHPFVTSSNSSVSGLTQGVGLTAKDVDLTLGIAKAFYMTRVGAGPFPTELGGEKSEAWCASHTRADEDLFYPDVDVNDPEPFHQGIAVRRIAGEYGATTGRPRRTGWLDLPLLRYAMQFNGNNLILSMIDVLSACEEIKICMHYRWDSGKVIYKGTVKHHMDVADMEADVLRTCQPVYKTFPGWMEDISGVRKYSDLHANVRNIVEYIEDNTNGIVRALSNGPDREQIIWRN